MTQALGLSPLDTIRRDRLMQLCDLYAEALDAVVAIMMAITTGQEAPVGIDPQLEPVN